MNKFVYEKLARIPFKELTTIDFTAIITMLPKSSKTLSRTLMRDVMKQEGILLTVITGHLYKDYILALLLKHAGEDITRRQYQSFSQKLAKVNELGYLESDEYHFLSEINKLRNKLAHDVFYDMSKWDIRKLPPIEHYGFRVPKNRPYRILLVEIVSKCCFVEVYDNIAKRNPWLYLENIPES